MEKIFDVIGIGFGPANLALAAAISENRDKPVSCIFLEKQPHFAWHKDMLIENAEMQISFLKDIATLRNPSSHYTFLRYLHEKKRLASFINLKNFHPSRIEFNNYFSWVAEKLDSHVKYRHCVIDVQPYGESPSRLLKVIAQNEETGQTASLIAKNIVVAVGGQPIIPSFVQRKMNSTRIFHTSEYLRKIEKYKKAPHKPYHFCVVGGGQSAAEIAHDLYSNFPAAKISCVYRGFGYKPADESHFSNEIFDSEAVDLFYHASEMGRNKLLKEHAGTNYSVVDIALIEKLYRIKYEESVVGVHRLHLKRFSSLRGAVEKDKHVELVIENTMGSQAEEILNVDAVFLATGYDYKGASVLLKTLSNHIKYNEQGKPEVNRHYRIMTDSHLLAGIYAQGCNEGSHGLTDTLLSLSAIRAKEIFEQIQRNCEESPRETCQHVSQKLEAAHA